MRRLRDHFGRKKFRHRKARKPQQVPRRPRTIVIANNLDSHIFPREFKKIKTQFGTTDAH
jgi:hypothetical protein